MSGTYTAHEVKRANYTATVGRADYTATVERATTITVPAVSGDRLVWDGTDNLVWDGTDNIIWD